MPVLKKREREKKQWCCWWHSTSNPYYEDSLRSTITLHGYIFLLLLILMAWRKQEIFELKEVYQLPSSADCRFRTLEVWDTRHAYTVYLKKYAHGFVVLCFVVFMQSVIMISHEVFIHIHQGCFAGTGAIVRLSQYQWSKPDGYGKISQCITTTKHSKAKTVCIFLRIHCIYVLIISEATIML